MHKILICLYFLWRSCNCQDDDNCYLDGVSSSEWQTAFNNEYVNDNHTGEFKRFNTTNIEGTPTTDGDYKKYFDVKLDREVLIISPSKEFKNFEKELASQEEFKLTVRINFICKRGNQRSLSFYQPITDLNTYSPEFDKPSYTYSLPMPLTVSFNLDAFGVDIRACDYDITNVRVVFEINPSDNFVVSWGGATDNTRKCHKLVIKTAKYLKLTTTTSYELKVTDIGNQPRSSLAQFIIEVDEAVSVPPNPQFSEPYYTAIYNSENEQHYITVNGPIRLKDGCSNNVLGALDSISYINVSCNSNEVTAQLTQNFPEDTLKNEYVVLVRLEATLAAAEEPGKTVLVVYLPKQECLQTTIASTECPPCTTVSTVSSTPPDCTETSTTSTNITTTECPPCTTVSTVASTECAPCSTVSTVTSTECPTASTITASSTNSIVGSTQGPPIGSVITFNVYRFTVTSSFIGHLGFVTATAEPEEKIAYTLQTGQPYLEYNKNSGLLTKTASMNIGLLEFAAIATGTVSQREAKAKIIINVVEDENAVSHSLIVEHVLENETLTLNPPCQYRKCNYKIATQYPSTSKELFVYDNATNLWRTSFIDREMGEFAEMLVPQVTLQLVLSDETVDYASVSNSFEDEKREWILLPSKIPSRPDQMLMTIVIDDINDNKPLFEIQGKLTIGYPTSELARAISVPYLTKVVATDRDAGKNAEIRYSTTSNYFTVHPKTGTIYPGVGALDDESNLKFAVQATDRNGEEDGLSDVLEIEVKLLKEDHIAVLVIDNTVLEDVDKTLYQLSQESGLTLRYLTATVTPVQKSRSSLVNYGYKTMNYLRHILQSNSAKDSVAEHRTEIIAYALDGDYKPLEADDIRKALKTSSSLESFTVEKWDSDWEEEQSVAGYIAAIAVLASLLAIFIIAALLFYYFKIYKTSKVNEDTVTFDDYEEPRNIGKTENVAQRRPTGFVFNPPPIDDEENEIRYNNAKNNLYSEKKLDWYENIEDMEKPNGNARPDKKTKLFRKKGEDHPQENVVNVANYSIPKDDLRLNENQEEPIYENDSPTNFNREQRKSVSFKETVEKINIIVDDPEKQDEEVSSL